MLLHLDILGGRQLKKHPLIYTWNYARNYLWGAPAPLDIPVAPIAWTQHQSRLVENISSFGEAGR